jgi:hypothetical protein
MEALCFTCTHSHVMEGPQTFIRCEALTAFNVPFPVYACNQYSATYVPSLYAMERIAHVLVVKNNKIVGFQKPEDREK